MSVATLLGITEDQIIAYFRRRKALSPRTAIAINLEDLKRELEAPEMLMPLSTYGFLKQASQGKYYLDSNVFNHRLKFILIFFALLGLVFLISLISSLQIFQ